MPEPTQNVYRPSVELEPDRLSVANALVTGGRALNLQLDSTNIRARFSIDEAQPVKCAAWAQLNSAHGPARILLDRIDFLPTVHALLGAPLTEALPSDLAAAVVELILESVPGAGLTVEAAGLGAAPADDGHAWRLALHVESEDGQALACGVLCCGQNVAQGLARALDASPARATGALVEPDAIGRVQLASILVPLKEFEGLQPLDILVLGAYGLGGKIPIRLFFAPGLFFFGSLEGETISMNTQEKEGAPNQDPAPAQNGPADLDKLPVRIAFEVGSVTMTLAELRAMASGTVVELPAPLDSPIVLRANGREIGTGTLLRVGDHVGVRILELGGGASERKAL